MERLRDESGETLLEILITMLVMGIGMVAVMGLMSSTIIGSDAHRNQAAAEVVAREYGELIKEKHRSLDPADFVPCPIDDDLEPEPAFEPDGWNTDITEVEYWVQGSPSDYPNGSFVDWATCDATLTTCPAPIEPKCAPGAHRVTIAIDNTGIRDDYAHVEITHAIVVRRNAE